MNITESSKQFIARAGHGLMAVPPMAVRASQTTLKVATKIRPPHGRGEWCFALAIVALVTLTIAAVGYKHVPQLLWMTSAVIAGITGYVAYILFLKIEAEEKAAARKREDEERRKRDLREEICRWYGRCYD